MAENKPWHHHRERGGFSSEIFQTAKDFRDTESVKQDIDQAVTAWAKDKKQEQTGLFAETDVLDIFYRLHVSLNTEKQKEIFGNTIFYFRERIATALGRSLGKEEVELLENTLNEKLYGK